jgi:hypothetical protein
VNLTAHGRKRLAALLVLVPLVPLLLSVALAIPST